MAKRISQLTQLTSSQVAQTDQVPIVDVSAGQTKYITVKDLTGLPDLGWTATGESWSYSSYSSVTHIGVITVPTDATTKYYKGMKIKITQTTGGTKYGEVVAVTATTLSVQWEQSKTLANEAITSPQYSSVESPAGMPDDNEFIYSQTNTGTMGGTIYFRNRKGIKEMWGVSATLTTTGVGPKTFTLIAPTGYFSAIRQGQITTSAVTTYAEQYSHWGAGLAAGTSTSYLVNAGGANAATCTQSYFIRGV